MNDMARNDPQLPPGARVHLVGGAVRDRLMGLPEGDRDWVVVGATPEQMTAAGYRPVGLDFPVFLHPRTQEEHALARTERKSGHGYHGFVFHTGADVTLEQDLARRDLTVNAMAFEADGVTVVDPWGGQADLAAKVLRHVGPAFAEDPVRILRLARFAARWPDFRVAPETMALCRAMTAAGEVDALVAERVWQELSRGLMAARPSRMLQVLREAGALARLLPEVDRLYGVPQRADHHPEVDTGVHVEMVLDQAARLGLPLAARFAALTHDLGKGTTPADILPRHIGHEGRSAALIKPLCERLRVPVDCRELADLVAREHGNVQASAGFDAPALVRLMDRCDAWRRPERFEQMLQACEADARGRLGLEDRDYPQAPRLRAALAVAQALDGREVVAAAQARGLKGPALGRALQDARVVAVEELLRAAAPPATRSG
jgi:tRNA nucleotidyltransferase (CCA-adding enzyme)